MGELILKDRIQECLRTALDMTRIDITTIATFVDELDKYYLYSFFTTDTMAGIFKYITGDKSRQELILDFLTDVNHILINIARFSTDDLKFMVKSNTDLLDCSSFSKDFKNKAFNITNWNQSLYYILYIIRLNSTYIENYCLYKKQVTEQTNKHNKKYKKDDK